MYRTRTFSRSPSFFRAGTLLKDASETPSPFRPTLPMAAKKKARPESEFDDTDYDDASTDSWSEDTEENADATSQRSAAPPGVRLRDWRDVERFREERALRRLLEEDDLFFGDD